MRVLKAVARRLRRRSVRVLIAVSAILGATMIAAPPANAASVWAMGNGIIINVQTGSKNYGNHTQWVSSISIQASTSVQYEYGCGRYEAWTQGFYASAYEWSGCGGMYWTINRWVGSGNYVCGAFTAVDTGWPRTIACIAIRV